MQVLGNHDKVILCGFVLSMLVSLHFGAHSLHMHPMRVCQRRSTEALRSPHNIYHAICSHKHQSISFCQRAQREVQCQLVPFTQQSFQLSAFNSVKASSSRSASQLTANRERGPEKANPISQETDKCNTNKVDDILAKLTMLFPIFVLSAAILAAKIPSSLLWVNRGSIITVMLASVMIGMGMTLTKEDFAKVFQSKKQLSSVPAGVLCQFGVMPLSALIVGKYLLNLSPSLYLGLILVGCSPGGTASNLVSLIANADVALSVVLTSCSTLMASAITPILVKILVSGGTSVSVNGWSLCAATAKVVLAPILLGMVLNYKFPKLCSFTSRFTPFASVLLVSLICGGVVSQNAAAAVGVGWTGVLTALKAVLLLHSFGFAAGYMIPRKVLGFQEKTARTISIETGMQNSALAVVLARSIPGTDKLASLPGALSATMHSCLGSMLAAYWRNRSKEPAEEQIQQ